MATEQIRALAPSLGGVVHSTIVAHYLNSYGTEEQKLDLVAEDGVR